MTVILPRDHHVRRTLEQNGVPCITPQAARRQDIRPLRIGILNIMPRAETYEFNLLLPLGRSILQIDPVWIRLESHTYSSTGGDHLARFYVTFKEWLDDFATPETQAVGEALLLKELDEVRRTQPQIWPAFWANYERTAAGERDLYF